jgi:hypothetical protein
MKTYEYDAVPFSEPRSHPWRDSASDAEARYYDFTANPELIRSSLEDFKPFKAYAAVEQLYSLLERINHPKSPLESSDSAFSGPHANETGQMNTSLECSGRVMLLYRETAENTRATRISWLKTAFHYQLARLDPKFSLGAIGTTLVPVRYLTLPGDAQLGQQLMVSFWAFGNSEPSVMQNLGRLFTNLTQAARGVSARILQGD